MLPGRSDDMCGPLHLPPHIVTLKRLNQNMTQTNLREYEPAHLHALHHQSLLCHTNDGGQMYL